MADATALAARTCVVIPALNESLRIREVVTGALAHCPNVIVIDDGSDDGTSECIADLPIVLLRHATRRGKGASLREGFAEALARGFDGALTMDGDGYRIADTQSGQRYYPANVCALQDVPGENFVFEAQILISASRELGVRVVSVPIESRYQGPGAAAQFRKSHFRPLQDLWRITSHVVKQVLGYGNALTEYRRTRAHPPVIHDPTGEFAPAGMPLPDAL